MAILNKVIVGVPYKASNLWGMKIKKEPPPPPPPSPPSSA